MRPSFARQKAMLACAMTDLLWKVKYIILHFRNLNLTESFQLGDEKYAVFAIMGPTLCFEIPPNYHKDNITEKVCLSK